MTPAKAEAGAMRVLLVMRADQIEGCTESLPEEAEFKAIADALEALQPGALAEPSPASPDGPLSRCRFSICDAQ